MRALSAPLQDPAAAHIGVHALLLGGLTAADTSTDRISVFRSGRVTRIGRLPLALHDAAAVAIGGAAYLFGGGDGTRQLDSIVRVDASGRAEAAGRLPAAASDVGAAAVDGTAYVVGGYTGTRWLDTIVAWRPGTPARVVAHLPTPLRYAAVTAAGRRLVVAGGSTPAGTASRRVLAFDPKTRVVQSIGSLPAATTHAAAAAIGSVAYVIGGRGAAAGTPSRRIVAVDTRSGTVARAGMLTSARSDLAVVAIGRDKILVAGGRGAKGTEQTLSELTPRTVRASAELTKTQTILGPPLVDANDVYAADAPTGVTGPARLALQRIYVPNSESDTVDVIDPHTFRVVGHFNVGALPQHVTPSYDLRTLYVLNDAGNSLTEINPRTAKPTRTLPVADPYNMYFTPDGRYAIVVAERLHRLDFRDAHSFRLHRSLDVPSCRGVDHMDFTADGRYLLASCEFSGRMIWVDVAHERLATTIALPHADAVPQDVKLSPDGKLFYVADMRYGGLWVLSARQSHVIRFIPTGARAHGLYPSRDDKYLYVTNRDEGSITVLSFRTHHAVTKWRIPGGSPDMGNVSVDGKVLWLSGRYSAEVYAISTRNGRLLARIHVGQGPHGLCVWPQPGRYSLGHTGILR